MDWYPFYLFYGVCWAYISFCLVSVDCPGCAVLGEQSQGQTGRIIICISNMACQQTSLCQLNKCKDMFNQSSSLQQQ